MVCVHKAGEDVSVSLGCRALRMSIFLPTGIYILIAVGAVMMFVGFLGCYGAIQESQCLLGTVRSWAGWGNCVQLSERGALRADADGQHQELQGGSVWSAYTGLPCGARALPLASLALEEGSRAA